MEQGGRKDWTEYGVGGVGGDGRILFLGSLTGTLVVAFAFFYVGGDGFGAGQRVSFLIDSFGWCLTRRTIGAGGDLPGLTTGSVYPTSVTSKQATYTMSLRPRQLSKR